MVWSLFLALLVMPQQPDASTSMSAQVAGPSQLRVAAPTFFRDGKVLGAASEWTLPANEPLVLYQYSGPDLM